MFMRSVLLVLSIAIFVGCTSVKVNTTLKDIESYIFERPDSALAVIESIDRSTLRNNGLKAHHALLHAMALDKNYIDVTDDSLASVAVRYYSNRGPKKYLARSLYYKGLSYFYDGKYDISIIELSKAEPVAAMHDSLYLGFIKVLQAAIYSSNFNENSEVELLEDAMNIYSSLNNEYYINVAKRSLAIAYTNIERYDDAERLLKELISSECINNRVLSKSLGDYAFLMTVRSEPNYAEAVNYYEKAVTVDDGRYMSLKDY